MLVNAYVKRWPPIKSPDLGQLKSSVGFSGSYYIPDRVSINPANPGADEIDGIWSAG